MVYLHPFDRLRLQPGCRALHRLRARPTAEFLAENGYRIGGMPAIFALLGESKERLSPPPVAPTGGVGFHLARCTWCRGHERGPGDLRDQANDDDIPGTFLPMPKRSHGTEHVKRNGTQHRSRSR